MIVLLMAVSTVGVGFALKAGMSGVIAANQVGGAQSVYVAEAGVSDALWKLRSDGTWRTGFTDKTFGPGSYTVTLADVITVPGKPYYGSVKITSIGTVNGIERELIQYVNSYTPALDYAVFTNGTFYNTGGATVDGSVYEGNGYGVPDADWTYLQNNAVYIPGDYQTTDGDVTYYNNYYVNGNVIIDHDNITIEGYIAINKAGGGGDLIVNGDNFRIIQDLGNPVLVVNNNIEFNGDYTEGFEFFGVTRAGGGITIDGAGFKILGNLMAGGNITVNTPAVIKHYDNPYRIRGVNGIVNGSGPLIIAPAELAWRQVFE